VFRAPRRGDRARLSVIWLAALLFALRAFLPTGFMPDADALRAGRFQIIFCSAAGPIPAGMAMIGHGMADSVHSTMAGHGMADPRQAIGSASHGAPDAGEMAGMGDMVAADPRMAQAHDMAGADAQADQAHDMTGANAQAVPMHDMPGHSPAPTTPDGSNMPADCPFGLTGAYTCAPPVVAITGPMLAVAWHMPVPAPFPAPLTGIVAGPPVGSRAPPPNLA
jgi:hypothetical protein